MNIQNEPFEDPYASVPREERHRTTIDISKADMAFIMSVRCRTGTLQTTIGILVTKFLNAIKQNGITSYDPDRYERAVASCIIFPGGSTEVDALRGQQLINDAITRSATVDPRVANACAEAANRDDGRRTPSVAQPDSGCPGEPSDTPSAPKDVKPRRGKGKGKANE